MQTGYIRYLRALVHEHLRFFLLVGLAAVALRLLFLLLFPAVTADSLVYGDIAKNWLQHRVYGFSEQGEQPGTTMLRSTLIRLPGYPMFLAACFRLFGMENYRSALYVQVAVDLLLTCQPPQVGNRPRHQQGQRRAVGAADRL